MDLTQQLDELCTKKYNNASEGLGEEAILKLSTVYLLDIISANCSFIGMSQTIRENVFLQPFLE